MILRGMHRTVAHVDRIAGVLGGVYDELDRTPPHPAR